MPCVRNTSGSVRNFDAYSLLNRLTCLLRAKGGRGGSVVERRTPEREVQGSNSTTAM